MASKSAKKKSSKKKQPDAASASSVPKKKSAVALAEAKAEKIVKASESADKKGGKKQNPVARYLKELRSEFKKVVWPSRKTVVNNTSVVLIAMIISSLVIWGLDSAFVALLDLIIR